MPLPLPPRVLPALLAAVLSCFLAGWPAISTGKTSAGKTTEKTGSGKSAKKSPAVKPGGKAAGKPQKNAKATQPTVTKAGAKHAAPTSSKPAAARNGKAGASSSHASTPATHPTPGPRHGKAIAAGAALGAAAVAGGSASLSAEKKADLDALRGRIDGIKRDLAGDESKRADVADQLRDSERAISNLSRDLRDLAGQRGDLQDALRGLNREAGQLEGTLGQQQAQLARLVQRQYQQGQPDTLQLLLNGNDPNQISRDLYYLNAIARERASLLHAIAGTLAGKKALADKTRDREAELAALENKQKAQQQKLAEQQRQRQMVLAGISAKISDRRKELGALERDEKQLTKLIDQLAKALARKPKPRPLPPTGESKPGKATPGEAPRSSAPEIANERTPEAVDGGGNFAALKGRLRLPVKGSVTNRFGAPRDGGGVWKGLFLRAASGTEVKAIAAGQVVFADWMRGFGNLLIVDHGGNYLSIYGYNEAVYRQVGDRVKPGETIATAGNSGGNAESGLYFELRFQGQPQDPLKWVALH